MVEGVLLRNTSISSFDFNCMIIIKKGKLRLIPKSEVEVEQEFWALEVRVG